MGTSGAQSPVEEKVHPMFVEFGGGGTNGRQSMGPGLIKVKAGDASRALHCFSLTAAHRWRLFRRKRQPSSSSTSYALSERARITRARESHSPEAASCT